MPKPILYLGNQLSNQTGKFTYMEGLTKLLEKEGFKVRMRSQQSNQILRLLSMIWAVLSYSRYAQVVIIDTYSTTAFWFAYLCAQLCWLLKVPYVPILHGGNLPQRLEHNPKLCQHLFAKAKVNVAPSAYLMQYFKTAGYTNIKHIPNTIAINDYTYRKREIIQPKLLWVRSFAHLYNPLLALKVLKALLKSYPNAKLSMVGPFKDDSIEICKKFAQQHQLPVTFTGGMEKKDWLAYAKDFDIFINTTNVDNTPVSVIEAMALGLPVVSTNVGGLPYLLEDRKDALLVAPKNIQAMLNAITELLTQPHLVKELTQSARQKAENFDWEQVKQAWVKVINT